MRALLQQAMALWLAAALLAPPAAAQSPQPQPVPAPDAPQQPTVNPRNAPPPPPPSTPQDQQQPPKGKQPPVIRSFTDLVLIDVEVTDRSGKPIQGLKPEQFTIAEDDHAQKISSFEYSDIEKIETAGTAGEEPVVVALAGSASPETIREEVRDRRLIVIFFDMSSMQSDELLRARDSALKFVQTKMSPADLVAVVTFGNRLGVLVNFTNDKDAVEQAVSRITPGKDVQLADPLYAAAQNGESDVQEDNGAAFAPDETEFNVFNTDRKLAAMEGLTNILRGVPGKKAVIQFSSGITQTGEENRTQLRAATDAANRANVSFYTVDSRGLMAAIPGGDATADASTGTSMFSGASVFRQIDSRQDSRDTLASLASDTGGRAFFDLGDLSEAFDKVQQDMTGYYLLGYYSANPLHDGKWRTVNVKVNVPGARIRFREGYYAPKTYNYYTTEDRERQLEDAMRADRPLVELPIALETAQFRLNDKEIFVPIAAKLSSSALQWAEKHGKHQAQFDFAAEVRNVNTGRAVAALRDTITVQLDTQRFQEVNQRTLLYQGGVILEPGNYKMKFLARENESGRVGTFEDDLVLTAPQPDRLALSTVLLSSQLVPVEKNTEVQKKAIGADAKLQHSPLEMSGQRIVPSVTRVFTRQQTLYVFFQAYYPAKADPANLRAGLAFFRGGIRVSATPLVEAAEVDPKTRTASFRISLPLDKLPTGRYTVQAIAVAAGSEYSAFARTYLALRAPDAPPAPAAAPTGAAAAAVPAAAPTPKP
jgi:VWFA-related protein